MKWMLLVACSLALHAGVILALPCRSQPAIEVCKPVICEPVLCEPTLATDDRDEPPIPPALDQRSILVQEYYRPVARTRCCKPRRCP